jgi:cell wall-associated NlpC family hydrolase
LTTLEEAPTRAAIVAEARSWIGTPWRHAADVKGRSGGVDCAMLLVRVYVTLGLVAPFDPRPYPIDMMHHRNDDRFLRHLLANAKLVATPQPGDAILFRYGYAYSHGGIVTHGAPLTIVHAYSRAKMVIEEDATKNYQLVPRLAGAKIASYWG